MRLAGDTMVRKKAVLILLAVVVSIMVSCSVRDIQGTWLFTMSQEQLFEGKDIIRTYTFKNGKIYVGQKPRGTYRQKDNEIDIILDMDIPMLPKAELKGTLSDNRSIEGLWITFYHHTAGPFPGTKWNAIKR